MDLGDIHDGVLSLVTELLENGAEPFEIAGVMSTVALSMYKTTLSPEDFNRMIDYISESRERVTRLDDNRVMH